MHRCCNPGQLFASNDRISSHITNIETLVSILTVPVAINHRPIDAGRATM